MKGTDESCGMIPVEDRVANAMPDSHREDMQIDDHDLFSELHILLKYVYVLLISFKAVIWYHWTPVDLFWIK